MERNKLDHTRARVMCFSTCKFHLYASKITHEDTWQLKPAYLIHSFTRSQKVRMLNSKWLAVKLVPKLRRNPKMKLREIIMKVQDKYVASISLGLATIARKKAMDVVQGSHKEQFRRLHDFCGEVLRSNPGSSCGVSATLQPVESPSRSLIAMFDNIYICLEVCKKSFASCKPIIGVDGCFLKGVYGGQLLTAVGRDPNDQMLPIAFAVVDKETRATWRWFLGQLLEDIGSHTTNRWTFVSDQQKCMTFSRAWLKELMWKAARATYPQEWMRVMREIEQINPNAYAMLMGIEPRFWTRSHLNGHPKCDTLVNNMSETFNSVILVARELPISSMKEMWSGNSKFVVTSMQDTFTVDLDDRECSCRLWDLTGIPCAHAISCINFKEESVISYVPKCFKKDAYVQCYSPLVAFLTTKITISLTQLIQQIHIISVDFVLFLGRHTVVLLYLRSDNYNDLLLNMSNNFLMVSVYNFYISFDFCNQLLWRANTYAKQT
ncbi:uncharacterized protein LOC120002548 [Tripterygium wilfordii]|uniref:uncharacterized protein LOC120002548 n=1 Tax=Tripterygium wilfordii TaxID=458696 RepID=UPI0018F8038E|nr:uncharacterized protein LOC120002548 [Tripterygium wilfordii]